MTISPYFLAITDMAEEELSHEHQLDEIATRVNGYMVDGIVPESFLTPSFLKYFPTGHGARSTDRCKLEQHFRIIRAVTGVTDDVC